MVSASQIRTNRIRILLVEDHAQVQKQLIALLNRESDFELVDAAVDSSQALQKAQSQQPDLLLIDPIMRDGLGLSTLRQLHASLPNMIVVVLTAVVDTTLKIRLKDMGLEHILSKGIPTSELLGELRSAASTLPRFSG
ncbi:MAG: response regulator [Anaerolineales bacterium]